MKKFKQIVAAALVAATVGTAGMTAFAASTSVEFWLNARKDGDIDFANDAKKDDSYSVPAHATAYRGADPSTPVTIHVYDRPEIEYYNTLTTGAEISENFETEYMRYFKTGIPGKFDEFWLGGFSNSDVDLYGWWAP